MAKVIRFIFLLVFTSGYTYQYSTDDACPFHKVAVVIDSTKKTDGFIPMRNVIYNIVRLLVKLYKKHIYLSAKVYHSNNNCTWINETGHDYLSPTVADQIKDKIVTIKQFKSNDTFNKNCAEQNLFSQYSMFKRYPKEHTAGILIVPKASYGNVSSKFVVMTYHNKTFQRKFRCEGAVDQAVNDAAEAINEFMCPKPTTTRPTTTLATTKPPTSQQTTKNHSTHIPTTTRRTTQNATTANSTTYHPTTPRIITTHPTTTPNSTTQQTTTQNSTRPTKQPTTTRMTTKSSTTALPLTTTHNHTTARRTTTTTKPHPKSTTPATTLNGTVIPTTNIPTTHQPSPTTVPIDQRIDRFIQKNKNISDDATDDEKIKGFMNGSVNIFYLISEGVPGRTNEKKIFKFKNFIQQSLTKIGKERQKPTNLVISIDDQGGMALNRQNSSTFKEISYSHGSNTFKMPKNPIKTASSLIVALVEYKTLPNMLQKGDNSSKPLAHDSFLLVVEGVTSSNALAYENTSVLYSLKIPWSASSKFEYKCVYWEGDNPNVNWKGSGCKRTLVKDSVVTCKCNYQNFRSYSVQREEKKNKRFSLYASTYIGCGVAGGVCLVLLLMFLVFSRSLRKDHNVIHFNLALSLVLSNGLYVAADFVYRTKWLCVAVSIGIMLSYLATFFWIFVESLHLYMLVVRMRKDSNMTKYYAAIGWVVPAVFVAIAGAVKQEFFDRGEAAEFCWLAYDMWPRWLFVGPSVFTITMSVLLLFKAITASFKMQRSMAGVERYQHVGKLVMVLIPIIGVARSSSLLAVGEKKDYFQYILTGCNGAVAVLAVISYCLLSPGIRGLSNSSSKYQKQTVRTSSGVTIGADNKGLGTDNKGKESSQLSLSVITEPAFHSKTNL